MFHEVNLSALPTHKNVNDQQDHAKWSCRDPIFILWILFELLRLETDPWGLNSILCTTQLLPCGFPDPGLFQTLFCFRKGCYSGALFFFFFGIQGPFSVLLSYKVTETKPSFKSLGPVMCRRGNQPLWKHQQVVSLDSKMPSWYLCV